MALTRERPELKGERLMLQFRWSLTKTEDNYERRGTFWISTDAGDFPCRGWKASPLRELIYFTSQTYDIVRTPYITKRDLPFGPYYVLLDSSQQGMVTLHFLRSYLPQPLEKLPSVTLPFFDFCRIVLEAGSVLLETYRSGDFGTPMELQSLERRMELLLLVIPKDQA
jgi:hypothetical protein